MQNYTNVFILDNVTVTISATWDLTETWVIKCDFRIKTNMEADSCLKLVVLCCSFTTKQACLPFLLSIRLRRQCLFLCCLQPCFCPSQHLAGDSSQSAHSHWLLQVFGQYWIPVPLQDLPPSTKHTSKIRKAATWMLWTMGAEGAAALPNMTHYKNHQLIAS